MKAGSMKGGRGGKRKGPARIGEIRVWGDGQKMQKQPDGKWKKVDEHAKASGVKATRPSVDQKKPPLDAKGQPPAAIKKALAKERDIQSRLYDASQKVVNSKGAARKLAHAEEVKVLEALEAHREKSGINKWREETKTSDGGYAQRNPKPVGYAKSDFLTGMPMPAVAKNSARGLKVAAEAHVMSGKNDPATFAHNMGISRAEAQAAIGKALAKHQKKMVVESKPSARNVAANRKAARDATPPVDPKINKALDKERQLQSKLYDVSRKVDGAKGAAAKAARAEEKAVQKELAQHRKDSGLDAWRSFSNPTVKDVSQRTARQREQTKFRTSKK